MKIFMNLNSGPKIALYGKSELDQVSFWSYGGKTLGGGFPPVQIGLKVATGDMLGNLILVIGI